MNKGEGRLTTHRKELIVGFVVLSVSLLLGVYLFKQVWALFRSLEPQLAASLLAASATVFVSVFSVLASKRIEQKKEIENQLREKKIPIYEEIIGFIFRITFAEKLGQEKPSDDEMMQFFTNTTKELVIWGSKDMVDAFGNFRSGLAANAERKDAVKTMSEIEDLLFAVRKDLGHSHKRKKRGDILRLFVTDVDEHLDRMR